MSTIQASYSLIQWGWTQLIQVEPMIGIPLSIPVTELGLELFASGGMWQ